jgi:hypothetical protein
MDQDFSPLRTGRRLTPELFDHYVAVARAERAKAIAEFGGWIARQVRKVTVRIASRAIRSALAARKLAG